jgi:uracil-DNA glycosylase family 4
MAWTERQRRMLDEMGLPAWLAPAQGVDAFASSDTTAATVAAVATGSIALPGASATAIATATASPTPTPPSHSPSPVQGHLPAAGPVAAPAESGPVAGLGWAALREVVSGCTACGLCQGRTQTVFGVGHLQAHWMVVGEAPGEQEDRQGEPFVGKSGQLLDNMLRALQLTRAEAPPERQVYIANILKCRPPGNRNPTPQELALCEPFLMRQVALVKPRIILAMGRFAVQSLLHSTEAIGKLRGRVHQYQGVPLIVTYHPAYLRRNPEEKARAWDDLCLAAETLTALPTLREPAAAG